MSLTDFASLDGKRYSNTMLATPFFFSRMSLCFFFLGENERPYQVNVFRLDDFVDQKRQGNFQIVLM